MPYIVADPPPNNTEKKNIIHPMLFNYPDIDPSCPPPIENSLLAETFPLTIPNYSLEALTIRYNNLIITNTVFGHKMPHKLTWYSNASREFSLGAYSLKEFICKNIVISSTFLK
jgi:hypothetical protein